VSDSKQVNQSNCQVVLTRSSQDNRSLAGELLKAGHAVVLAPALEFSALPFKDSESELLQEFFLGKFQLAIFTSRNAAHYFRLWLDLFQKKIDSQQVVWPAATEIAAIGKGSSAACKHEFARSASIVATEGNARSLVADIQATGQKGRLLLLKPKKSLPQIEFEFKKFGSRLVKLDCYETVKKVDTSYQQQLQSEASVVFVFFSPSAFIATRESFGDSILKAARIVTIGRTTSSFIKESGFLVWKQSSEPSEAAVLALLLAHL
jgi:uroporphyrinogen-III synthase